MDALLCGSSISGLYDCDACYNNTHSYDAVGRAAELERRITELTSSSESVAKRLDQAERSLRHIDLSRADDSLAAVRRRRSPAVAEFSLYDDNDDVEPRPSRIDSRHRVCLSARLL